MTGRIADGVILQLADPDLIAWSVGQVRAAEAAAGRLAGSVRVPGRGAGPCRRSCGLPRADSLVPRPRLETTSSTSSTSTPARSSPELLTGYIRDREGYDYLHHAEVGSSNAGFVGDEVTDRFCVLGSVEHHVRQAPSVSPRPGSTSSTLTR